MKQTVDRLLPVANCATLTAADK